MIGDIHGRADLLDALHVRIEADIDASRDREPVLVYLGDYVDRGPDSRAVLEALSSRAPRNAVRHFLKGNHEETMLAFLGGSRRDPGWLESGGAQTLASYGVDVAFPWTPETLERMACALSTALPDHHMRFLRGLVLFRILGDYLFVHAGIRPGVPPARQAVADMLHGGKAFLNASEPHPYMVVHGHHATTEPDVRPNRIGIDTGAFATGRLTCLVLEDDRRGFLSP